LSEESRDEDRDALASIASLELPTFDGPLVACDPAPGGAPGGPVYLGGDLHRTHPEAVTDHPKRRRDVSLDEARIVLSERGEESLEVNAVEGVWCLALFGDQVESAHHFALWDTEGRLRIWLFLPAARLMVGLAHLWLRSVPPPFSFD